MKKLIVSLVALATLLGGYVGTQQAKADTQLLSSPWNFVINNGADEKYGPSVGNIADKASLTLTYDLNGTCILGGDASAIIFDQNGWKYVSLSSYGQNCIDGNQTVTIPLSAFGLNLSQNVGTFHARFWKSGGPWTVDISSAVLNDIVYPTPYSTPYSTPYQTPYATPYPTPTPTWGIQGVDVMKYSKDVLCNPPTQTFMNQEADKAAEVGANYLSISGFYDSPTCGSALTILTNWVNTARAHNLKVWFRMKDLKFEGDYSQPKTFNPDGMRHQKLMVDWIAANNLVQNGDIFTPNAEPQNGGINGVTYCGSPANCQFTGKSDFNIWLQQIHIMADLGFKAKGLTGVKVGYYGFDGFIAAGLGNPDWQGQSQLEASTIAMMGPVAIDHYPETIGHTLAQDMAYIKQALGANTRLIVSEYGTITTSNETTQATQLNDFATTVADPANNFDGFNYWHLGPGGNEALIRSDFTNKPTFGILQSYYQ